MSKKVVYIVMEQDSEGNYEQALVLKRGGIGFPDKGILDFPGSSISGEPPGKHRASFATPKEAREAIKRTTAYSAAFGYGELMPQAKNCKIVSVELP